MAQLAPRVVGALVRAAYGDDVPASVDAASFCDRLFARGVLASYARSGPTSWRVCLDVETLSSDPPEGHAPEGCPCTACSARTRDNAARRAASN